MSAAGETKEGPQDKGFGDNQRSLLRSVVESNGLVVFFAFVAALVVGAVLVVFADEAVQDSAGYFFSRPSDLLSAAWTAIADAYVAMFQGSIYNLQAESFSAAIKPLTNSLTFSAPLIFAGLGLGVGFRAGLFNIGAQGQVILGAIIAGFIGFSFDLPVGLHLALAIVGAVLGGALWGFIPGVLKATTGAHEVIVTIMLNYVGLYLLAWLLSLESWQLPGSGNPKSPPIEENAQWPSLLGDSFGLHWGFIAALLAAWGVWWLMERSTWGFTFRAVGANPSAATIAGMNVKVTYVLVMVIAGTLAGLAGGTQVLGTEKALTTGIAGSIGFDAITVALLGRSRPAGIVAAGILFGGLRASGPTLQVQAGLPIDIVLVIQSVIVLFIAAPPLVRFLFRLPEPRLVKEVTA
ncbi:ABC transporter permease [Demequina sp. TTPB684]|uniref:ABC transporter permease n=1 Tax=unclassified Demequina TaxID=2620311 RepID=UPI001CF516A5|nr:MULTISPECIES: ABC transporter permease [unclassified Demequina]MCB2411696.1 ABC transporter permease [Demequina sp. TTPB684]UPU87274.1 ABC transporter permease [Demequina sp. TMPB413]